MHLPSMTDTRLGNMTTIEATVQSAATGDEAAFAHLVVEHHASMSRVAFVICGDAESARDAVQNAWAAAWHRIRSLRDPSQVRPWLVAIAANEARQMMRRRRRIAIVDLSDELAEAYRADADTSVELLDLHRALRGLKPEDRALLAMRYAAGLDSTEIARQLGMSASGVRSRLSRIIEHLRADLALEPGTEA